MDASVTDLITRARAGDAAAAATLMNATYDDLRALARARLASGGRSATLDTTALVHEWYIRFAKTYKARIEDRVHFMRYASVVMRSVIVDAVRRRQSYRRGGGVCHEELTDRLEANSETEVTQVHEALERLSEVDARMAAIVEMRYFGGMTETDIAAALGVTARTVRREWTKARMWLAEALA